MHHHEKRHQCRVEGLWICCGGGPPALSLHQRARKRRSTTLDTLPLASSRHLSVAPGPMQSSWSRHAPATSTRSKSPSSRTEGRDDKGDHHRYSCAMPNKDVPFFLTDALGADGILLFTLRQKSPPIASACWCHRRVRPQLGGVCRGSVGPAAVGHDAL